MGAAETTLQQPGCNKVLIVPEGPISIMKFPVSTKANNQFERLPKEIKSQILNKMDRVHHVLLLAVCKEWRNSIFQHLGDSLSEYCQHQIFKYNFAKVFNAEEDLAVIDLCYDEDYIWSLPEKCRDVPEKIKEFTTPEKLEEFKELVNSETVFYLANYHKAVEERESIKEEARSKLSQIEPFYQFFQEMGVALQDLLIASTSVSNPEPLYILAGEIYHAAYTYDLIHQNGNIDFLSQLHFFNNDLLQNETPFNDDHLPFCYKLHAMLGDSTGLFLKTFVETTYGLLRRGYFVKDKKRIAFALRAAVVARTIAHQQLLYADAEWSTRYRPLIIEYSRNYLPSEEIKFLENHSMKAYIRALD